MAISRRKFLKLGTHAAFGSMLVYTLRGMLPGESGPNNADAEGDAAWSSYNPEDHSWAFIVDTMKCIGCGLCARACKLENNVPWEASCNRTWVERYRFLKDGEVLVDSPNGGINGFYNPTGAEPIVVEPTVDYNENGLPNYIPPPNDGAPDVSPEEIQKSFFVPKLCNQCDNSPCTQVCPVGATYKTRDGIVLVNQNRCIGCRYCIQACPYGARYLVPKGKVTPTGQSGVVDKCTWCYHRITKGLKPACVEACPVGARVFGDLNDPESDVSKILAKERIQVLKPDLGTKPKVKYIGLDEAVR